MFGPSRSSSDPPRKQIQELFSLSTLWDPKCSQVSVTEGKVYRLYKLNWLCDGFNLLLSDMAVRENHCTKDNTVIPRLTSDPANEFFG